MFVASLFLFTVTALNNVAALSWGDLFIPMIEKAKQNQTPPVLLENAKNLKYVGCYLEQTDRRTALVGSSIHLKKTMTPSYCVTYCVTRSYMYAGVMSGEWCQCGSSLDHDVPVAENECYVTCPGDANLKCGGNNRLSVYDSGYKQGALHAKYVGCYVDPSTDSRLMRNAMESFNTRLTNRICQQFCKLKGYRYSGTEIGYECFCSHQSPPYKSLAEDEDCNSQCQGSAEEMCGGSLRLSVYDVSEGEDNNPVISLYEGCLPASIFGIAAPKSSNLMTTQYCVGYCYKMGFRLAAVQAGIECYCDNEIEKIPPVKENYCSTPCKGNHLQKCGGNNYMSVYKTGIPDKRVNPTSTYKGCYYDNKERLLNGARFTDNALSNEKCIKYCFDRAYHLAGTEFGRECYCGDEASDDAKAVDQECQIGCPGDPGRKCGGHMRLSVYDTGIKNYEESLEKLCVTSMTLVKGEHSCTGKVVFNEEFAMKEVDTKLWEKAVYMPMAPDYPFVVYHPKEANMFIDNGKLVIRPSLMDDFQVQQGKIDLKNCTGYLTSEECVRQAVSFNILPPVESAMITTRDSFFFKYGRVEIRAKLPSGDWLVPVIWLEPKRQSYGPYYSSGRIVLAMARGNSDLKCGSMDMGNGRLETGIFVGVDEHPFRRMLSWQSAESWSHQFHNFTFTWTPDNLYFSVDGASEKKILSKPQTIKDLFGSPKVKSAPWASSSLLAPFDDEFYISIGLYAGGMIDFRDECISRGHSKPWKNFDVKAMANFWVGRNHWKTTWNDNSALTVDYVKVTAI